MSTYIDSGSTKTAESSAGELYIRDFLKTMKDFFIYTYTDSNSFLQSLNN